MTLSPPSYSTKKKESVLRRNRSQKHIERSIKASPNNPLCTHSRIPITQSHSSKTRITQKQQSWLPTSVTKVHRSDSNPSRRGAQPSKKHRSSRTSAGCSCRRRSSSWTTTWCRNSKRANPWSTPRTSIGSRLRHWWVSWLRLRICRRRRRRCSGWSGGTSICCLSIRTTTWSWMSTTWWLYSDVFGFYYYWIMNKSIYAINLIRPHRYA